MTLHHLTAEQKILRHKEQIRAWRKAHPDYVREKGRARVQEPRNAHKVRARRILQRSARRGVTDRGLCVVCRKPNAEAHHANYSDPLDVVWLCQAHHIELHDRILRELNERFPRPPSLSNLIWSP